MSNSSGGFFDVAAGRAELKRIEVSAFSPDFWNDPEAAQALLQKRSILEKKIRRQEQFEGDIEDAEVLLEFAEEDEGSLKELRSLIERLEHGLSQAEIEMLLAGDEFGTEAVRVTLTAGCEVEGASPVSSDREGTTRYDDAPDGSAELQGTRRYVFDGGCVTW